MKKVNFLLVVLSAVLYAVPFLYSAYAWWLVFFFPVPLFYVASKNECGFRHGFLWGLVTFLLHGCGGVSVVAHMAHDYWLLGIALGLSIVIYQAVCVGIIFWLFQQFICFFNVQCVISKLCSNTLMLAFVIFWIDRGSFFIFGVVEGYPLMHPLLVLMRYPPLLFLLPFIGKQLVTMVFLCFSLSVVGCMLFQNRAAGVYFVLAIVPWVLSVGLHSMQQKSQDPLWVKYIVALPSRVLCTSLYPVGMIKSVAQEIRIILKQYPEAQSIIMPESAFDSAAVSTVPDLLELWGEQYVGKPIHMVFGALRVRDGKYYNCAHWVYNGALQKCFDKRHTMVLSERIPGCLLDCDTIRSMYRANGCSEIACSLDQRSKITMNDVVFVPYLCSELFFNEYPDDLYDNQSLLILVNDSVFGQSHCSRYVQDLLVLLARFKAVMWQRDSVYVSYAYSVFINKQGGVRELQQ